VVPDETKGVTARMTTKRKTKVAKNLVPSEHDEQAKFFKFVRGMAKEDKRYANVFAVPNSGAHSKSSKSSLVTLAITYPLPHELSCTLP